MSMHAPNQRAAFAKVVGPAWSRCAAGAAGKIKHMLDFHAATTGMAGSVRHVSGGQEQWRIGSQRGGWCRQARIHAASRGTIFSTETGS